MTHGQARLVVLTLTLSSITVCAMHGLFDWNLLARPMAFVFPKVNRNASFSQPGKAASLSFQYENGKPLAGAPAKRSHAVSVGPTQGQVYAYATFEMTAHNPASYIDGMLPGVQLMALGQTLNGRFIPAVRFGLQDGKGLPGEQGQLVPWALEGQFDNFGPFARPATPYDFKIHVDLAKHRMSLFASGRGDDDWFVLVDDVPLLNAVSEISEICVEQNPGAGGIRDVVVQPRPSASRDRVQPHPRAKKNRVVKAGAGFRLQSMRSLWQLPGRHVTISRDPRRWHGFPDVVCTRSGKLITTYCDGPRHGGRGKATLRTSSDLGRSWSAEQVMVETDASCERLQRLKDGSLLYIGGERRPTVDFRRSTDDGQTWQAIGGFDIRPFGLKVHYSMSHVLEASDGAWLIVGSDTFPISEQAFDSKNRFRIRERLQVFQSKDQGKSWEVLSLLDTYPTSGHAGSEASILELPGNRLAIYARESRNDGYPGFRVFSADRGKSWSEPEDLPLQVIGRVQAGLLSDGRVMLTTRTGMGKRALWAWTEDPEKKIGFQIGGVHINDHRSKGLKDGALAIDSDGASGEFTRYLLRPPDGPESAIELIAEVMVKENQGHAATIAIPFAGQLRIFPDHVMFVGSESSKVAVSPGRFHTYELRSGAGKLRLVVDGELKIETAKLDSRRIQNDWSPAVVSPLLFSFGNYPDPEFYPPGATANTSVVPLQITPAVTGLSLWKRVEVAAVGVGNRPHLTSWIAARDGFPDQYQLDHVLEVQATAFGADQGYPGWTELPDGRVFVVNYTDDKAPAWPASSPYLFRCPWIRGTHVFPSDLAVR